MVAPTESAPAARRRGARAHGQLRAGLAMRSALAGVGCAVLVVAAVLLARAGVVDHAFPPFVAGTQSTTITSYSGPYLVAAMGVGALAGLLLISAVTDLWRRALLGRSLADCRPGLGH